MVQKEYKKRRKRKYGQAKLKHAKRGIASCGVSVIVFILLAIMIGKAYFSRGTAAPYIGAVGLITMALAGITCKIGVGCSAFLLLAFIFMFCRGLF